MRNAEWGGPGGNRAPTVRERVVRGRTGREPAAMRTFRGRISRLPFAPQNLANLPIKTHNPTHFSASFTRLLPYTQKMCGHCRRSSRTAFARLAARKNLSWALASWSAVASTARHRFGRALDFQMANDVSAGFDLRKRCHSHRTPGRKRGNKQLLIAVGSVKV